jgi:hypothetical protein
MNKYIPDKNHLKKELIYCMGEQDFLDLPLTMQTLELSKSDFIIWMAWKVFKDIINNVMEEIILEDSE